MIHLSLLLTVLNRAMVYLSSSALYYEVGSNATLSCTVTYPKFDVDILI